MEVKSQINSVSVVSTKLGMFASSLGELSNSCLNCYCLEQLHCMPMKKQKQEEYCVYRVLNAATFHIYYYNSYLPFRVNL